MKSSSGFLNINKPSEMTSHDVVAILRKKLGIKKIGHSGTLDPFATGVLAIGINEATRLFEYIPSDKMYLAEIVFGIETDTDDITGKIIKKENVDLSLEQIKEKLKQFIGKIKQKPPIYSAINIDGKRAYDLARENKITLDDMKERESEIYSLEILDFNDKLKVKIHCSSGTYIRSIARDLGKELGTCAILQTLERVQIGSYFKIKNSKNLEFVDKSNLQDILIKPENVLKLEKIILSEDESIDVFHGRSVKLSNEMYPLNSEVQLFNKENEFIAIGLIGEGNKIMPKKVFLKNEQ